MHTEIHIIPLYVQQVTKLRNLRICSRHKRQQLRSATALISTRPQLRQIVQKEVDGCKSTNKIKIIFNNCKQ